MNVPKCEEYLCKFYNFILSSFALRTDFNNTLVIRRDNGLNEWLIFRERSELDRMVKCLRQHWQLPVVECGDECVVKPEFNQLLLESAQMKDLWREVPTEPSSNIFFRWLTGF